MKKVSSCTQAHPMCNKETCVCKNKNCDYLHKQYGMKKWVFMLILFTISVGLFVPFFAEVICSSKNPDASSGLAVWNQFVSIILGIVATILSIVSIIMGFKNYDDTLQVQEKYMEALKEISKISKDLDNVSNVVNKMSSSLDDKVPVEVPKSIPDTWDKDPYEA